MKKYVYENVLGSRRIHPCLQNLENAGFLLVWEIPFSCFALHFLDFFR